TFLRTVFSMVLLRDRPIEGGHVPAHGARPVALPCRVELRLLPFDLAPPQRRLPAPLGDRRRLLRSARWALGFREVPYPRRGPALRAAQLQLDAVVRHPLEPRSPVLSAPRT